MSEFYIEVALTFHPEGEMFFYLLVLLLIVKLIWVAPRSIRPLEDECFFILLTY